MEHRFLVASFATVTELKQRYNGFTVVGEEKSAVVQTTLVYIKARHRSVSPIPGKANYLRGYSTSRLDHTGFFDGLC